MSDPLKLTVQTSKKAPRAFLAASAIALSFGLFALSAPAGAAPLSGTGLMRPAIEAHATQAQNVGYRRYKKSRRIYVEDFPPPRYPSYPNYAKQPSMPFGGSAEILELQRRFPQTNWPSSMRYF
jgi:hypothetical protein